MSSEKSQTGRRNFLKTLAALPCAAAGYFIYDELTEYDGPPRTVGARPVPDPKPVSHLVEDEYCFYALGDTGLASERRNAVVEQMVKQSRHRAPDSIFLVGDNFYDKGVQSVDDSLWQTHFERPFSKHRFPVPFYACLGNHDYFGNIAAQSEYSRTHPRWNMPAPYYSFVQPIDLNCSVQFFVLDTTPINEGDYSTGTQVRWLCSALKRSKSQYKIVVGHHPLYSGGEHGRSRRNFKHVAPLLDQFGVDLYVCGHDHDLQLHDTQKGWLHLVTGAGSKLRSVDWIRTTMFAQAASGFSKVTLNSDEMAIEIFSTEGLVFSHRQPRKNQLASPSQLANGSSHG